MLSPSWEPCPCSGVSLAPVPVWPHEFRGGLAVLPSRARTLVWGVGQGGQPHGSPLSPSGPPSDSDPSPGRGTRGNGASPPQDPLYPGAAPVPVTPPRARGHGDTGWWEQPPACPKVAFPARAAAGGGRAPRPRVRLRPDLCPRRGNDRGATAGAARGSGRVAGCGEGSGGSGAGVWGVRGPCPGDAGSCGVRRG